MCLWRSGESQSRINGHLLPFVKFLQDQSLLALYSRLFAGLPAHAPAVPFSLPVADKPHQQDAKLSPMTSLRDYATATLRFHPYMTDTLARRHLHAFANHR